jgi:glycosyltransferase involved in cell wall biosynthesis
VGRLDQNQKNVLCIAKIASLLSDRNIPCVWTIVGDGPDREAMEWSVRRQGVGDRFTFTGSKCREDVEQLTSEHHILILPSFFESVGHVLQEAQILGVVPIATWLEGATDFVITDGHDGRLCDSHDAHRFADAIAALHRDRRELARLSANALNSVRRRFAISIVSTQYRTMFEELRSSTARRTNRRRTLFGFRSVPGELMPTRLQTAVRRTRRLLRGA